jgi:hypothetical protein
MSPLFLALIPVPFAALLVFVVWRVLRAVPRYAVRPHEKTEWGQMFAIVDLDGRIVGLDRWKPANERCAALNSRGNRRLEQR